MRAKDWIVIVKFNDGKPTLITDLAFPSQIWTITDQFDPYTIKSIKLKPSIKA